MKYSLLVLLTLLLLSGCGDEQNIDKKLFKDLESGKIYRVEHKLGITYYITELPLKSVGDTITLTKK